MMSESSGLMLAPGGKAFWPSTSVGTPARPSLLVKGVVVVHAASDKTKAHKDRVCKIWGMAVWCAALRLGA
jgi:hypothetical protein